MAKKVNENPEVLKLVPEQGTQQQEEKEVYVTFEMQQAIDVLFQAVEMGRKAGIYSFKDAGFIGQAVETLAPYGITKKGQ